MIVTATRYHDFSAGHRVVGHENKCAWLHGHNYRVHFTCTAQALDRVGRVIDFSAIKHTVCDWLETNWDHKFLAWKEDDALLNLLSGRHPLGREEPLVENSIVWVLFNPTAENMALNLLRTVGPFLLRDSGIVLSEVQVDETRKCSATASLTTNELQEALIRAKAKA